MTDASHPGAAGVLITGLSAVVANFFAVGVRYFVMAGSVADQEEADGIRAALPFPVSSVELRAPWDVIEQRLRSSPTAGRLDDLAEARRQLEAAQPGPSADAVVDADRPVADVAAGVLAHLGWTDGTPRP